MSTEIFEGVWVRVEEKDRMLQRKRELKIDHRI